MAQSEINKRAVKKYRKTSKGIAVKRACHKRWRSKWRWQNNLKNYGVSIEQFHKMMAEQGGKCAICHAQLIDRRYCVDHCHKSNHVRGLLCNNCNAGIGLLKDDPNILCAAATYLTPLLKVA